MGLLIPTHLKQRAISTDVRGASGNPLWCIAYEQNIGGSWVAKLEYAHGKDRTEALFHFNRPLHPGRARLVAVAPAIGGHSLDEHGDRIII